MEVSSTGPDRSVVVCANGLRNCGNRCTADPTSATANATTTTMPAATSRLVTLFMAARFPLRPVLNQVCPARPSGTRKPKAGGHHAHATTVDTQVDVLVVLHRGGRCVAAGHLLRALPQGHQGRLAGGARSGHDVDLRDVLR